MPLINLFTGLAPRVPKHLKGPGMAMTARDVDLRSGSIKAWRSARKLAEPGPDVLSAILLRNGEWEFWNTCVEATEYLPDYGRLYVTGRSERPEVADVCSMPLEYFYLGVPAPRRPPLVQGPEILGEDSDARSYVYTYINRFGEMSAPSPASVQLTVRDGDPVRVYGMSPPPDGWGVEAIAVWRSATGVRKTLEDMQAPGSAWLLVYIISSRDGELTDDLMLKELHEALSTETVRVPPAGLRQISCLGGTGTLCGVEGHRLYFSENFQPWNWPVENEMTFPYDIVNMRTMGGSGDIGSRGFASTRSGARVFLTTTAGAYVVEGLPPCSDNLQSRQVHEVTPHYPDLGCGRPNSAVMTPFGMVYSASVGLVLIKSDGSCDVLTALWYTSELWKELRPDTARLAFWQGLLFCVTDAESLVLEIDPKTYGDGDVGILTTLSARPRNLWTTESGELLMLEGGSIRQFNAGKGKVDYDWESADLEFEGRTSPSSARVRTDGTTMTLKCPVPGLEYSRFVSGDKPFRLGRLGRHLKYRLEFKGQGAVESAELGVSEFVERGESR
ncbi:MAG: hypothetical protein LBQ12_14220 [Deltaproteobacteria bacterium]|jgi:hypothetical protein|nr:hypothetical protein [Deltaproteobacteria bacterium]